MSRVPSHVDEKKLWMIGGFDGPLLGFNFGVCESQREEQCSSFAGVKYQSNLRGFLDHAQEIIITKPRRVAYMTRKGNTVVRAGAGLSQIIPCLTHSATENYMFEMI